jgi:hypothetical protein
MRVLLFLVAALFGIAAAHAQTSVYYAERGHWSVMTTGQACRALNRPPADFNAAPYNGLQIVARPGSGLGVEVFFWPQAIDPAKAYRLTLTFSAGQPITLDAKATIGDYMLASADEAKLWRLFQDAKTVQVGVDGEPKLMLIFGLDDIEWVLGGLTSCRDLLPKE